jgi:ABC-type xylose transport system permease subunit
MDDPIDARLAGLTRMTMPPALDRLEANVFAALDEEARHRSAGRMIGLWSVSAALILGLIGGASLGGGVAKAAGPIGVDDTLAPSTLLLGR